MKKEEKILKSKTGYTCPNCESYSTLETLIDRTEIEFIEAPDPYYSWEETHKCDVCKTIYTLDNGT